MNVMQLKHPDDPIFIAIERHRIAEKAMKDAMAAGVPDIFTSELAMKRWARLVDLVKTTPTTVAGCAALLRHIEAVEIEYEEAAIFGNCSDDVKLPALNLLSRIAATLEANA